LRCKKWQQERGRKQRKRRKQKEEKRESRKRTLPEKTMTALLFF
jgi:hypothetical protein